MTKSKIKTGDKVYVKKGKDIGKTGNVIKVLKQKQKVLIKGINIVKKHVKPRGQQQGGIFEIEKPVSIANIALVCPSCKKAVKVGYEIKGGIKNRICKKCQAVITNSEKSKK